MQELNQYIYEKLIINKNMSSKLDILDRVFNNLEEVAEACKEYFGDDVLEDIKISKRPVKFKIGMFRSNAFTVKKYFKLRTSSLHYIRFGEYTYKDNSKKLLVQVFLRGDIFSKIDEKHLYTFGKDNFLNYIKNIYDLTDDQKSYTYSEVTWQDTINKIFGLN